MQNSPTPKSRFPFAWIFTWRTLRRLLIGAAVLATFMAIFYIEENIRGRHAWNRFKRDFEAKGENFDWQTYVPPKVPDDENFAMTPFFAPMFDFNAEPRKPGQSVYRDTNALHSEVGLPGDIKGSGTWTKGASINFKSYLAALNKPRSEIPSPETAVEHKADAVELLQYLQKFQPVLEELETASHRPYARFNIHYDDADPFMILLPHLAVLKRVSILFQVRASAELALGKNEAAFKDTQMVFYLGDTIKQEPFLICGLVRLAIFQIGLQTVWEGMASHQWNNGQLAEFEQRFGKLDFLADYGVQMGGGEGAFHVKGIDFIRHENVQILDNYFSAENHNSKNVVGAYLMAGGWFDQNKIALVKMHEKAILPAVDAVNHRVHPRENALRNKEMDQQLHDGFYYYNFLAIIIQPSLEGAAMKYALAQTRANEAMTACALERHWLAHGKYPETLDPLAPQFIDKIPKDLFSDAPLKYRKESSGQFTLYSVGWNETDDAGEMKVKTNNKNGDLDLTGGDWVWPSYPEPSR